MRTRTRRVERPPPPVVVVVTAEEENDEPAASSDSEEDAKPAFVDPHCGSLALVSSGSTDDDDDNEDEEEEEEEEDGSAAADSSARRAVRRDGNAGTAVAALDSLDSAAEASGGKPASRVCFESTDELQRTHFPCTDGMLAAAVPSGSAAAEDDGEMREEGEGEEGPDDEGPIPKAFSSEDSAGRTEAAVQAAATAGGEGNVDEASESPTRDPKRRRRSVSKERTRRDRHDEPGPLPMSPPPPLLEASIGGRTVRVRVTPELKSEANNGDGKRGPRKKRVTWRSPLAEFAKEDPTTSKLRRLVARALRQGDDDGVRSHGRSVVAAELRRLVVASDDPSWTAAVAVRLGGVRVLANAMRRRTGRPVLLAEALGALSELVWLNSHVGVETIDDDDEEGGGSCLDLAIAAMERHPAHAGVQRTGCGYLRALSHDAACCARLKKSRAAATAADSIRRNPRKVDVVTEGSMFLQNMMVVSPTATAKILLRSNRGGNADGRRSFLSTILTVIQANRTNVDLVSAAFGLLSNVALGARGGAVLGKSGAGALAADAVRDHPNSPELLSTAFKLLCNTLNIDESDGGSTISDLVDLALQSMEDHPEDESVQISACQLTSAILDSRTPSQRASVQELVGGENGSRILRLAGENFPEGCEDSVDRILS